MNSSGKRPVPAFAQARVLCLLVGLLVLPILLLHAAPPAWWSQRGATNGNPPDDTAVANLGQLKHIASKAAAELNAHLPGGAGTTIDNLITTWQQPPTAGVTRDDTAALTVGQLKSIAKPYYDRLIAIGYTTTYPWTTNITTDDDNTALANLGQIKKVFGFDLLSVNATLDTDGNTLPDWWEIYYYGQTGVDPQAVAAGGALSNLQKFQGGFDPTAQSSAGDGLSDQWKLNHGYNVGDVVSTQRDGVPDSWKIANGLDPADPTVADTDSDADDLTNREEYRAGTNPWNQYTDGDMVMDGQDGFPRDTELHPPRLPDVHYAVIDLSKLGFGDPVTPNQPSAEIYMPYQINDNLQVLGVRETPLGDPDNIYYNQSTILWSGSTQTSVEVPILSGQVSDPSEVGTQRMALFYSSRANGSANILNSSGMVCGLVPALDAGNTVWRAATWSLAAGTAILPAYSGDLVSK